MRVLGNDTTISVRVDINVSDIAADISRALNLVTLLSFILDRSPTQILSQCIHVDNLSKALSLSCTSTTRISWPTEIDRGPPRMSEQGKLCTVYNRY